MDIRQLYEKIEDSMDIRAKLLDKSVLSIIGIAVLTFLIIIFAIQMPNKNKIMRYNHAIQNLQEKNVLLSGITNQQEKVDLRLKRFEHHNTLDWLMDQIVDKAEKAQIKINSITPQSAQDFPPFKKISVQVGITGQYHDLGKLIELIENNEKFIWIDSSRLDKKGLEGKVLMTISTFFLPDENN